jgi:hypothetical protein
MYKMHGVENFIQLGVLFPTVYRCATFASISEFQATVS